jgi:hypothetical protein
LPADGIGELAFELFERHQSQVHAGLNEVLDQVRHNAGMARWLAHGSHGTSSLLHQIPSEEATRLNQKGRPEVCC